LTTSTAITVRSRRKKVRNDAVAHRSQLHCDLLAAQQAQLALSSIQEEVFMRSDAEWIEDEIQTQIESQADFDFVKINILNHFAGHIRHFGAPSGASTEGTEHLHRILKDGYRHSGPTDQLRKTQQATHMCITSNPCTNFAPRDLRKHAIEWQNTMTNIDKRPRPIRLGTWSC
jgi:hypothetical protein